MDPEMLKNLELLMDLEILEVSDDWEAWEQAGAPEEDAEEEQ